MINYLHFKSFFYKELTQIYKIEINMHSHQKSSLHRTHTKGLKINFFQTILAVLITCSYSQNTSMVEMSITQSGKKMISSVRCKSANFIYLQEVQNESNGLNGDKWFVRTVLVVKNNIPTITQRKSLMDQKRELQMIAIQRQKLNCAIFHNKTDNKHFIYRFLQNKNQRIEFKDNDLNSSVNTSTIMISIDCIDIYIAGYTVGIRNIATDENETLTFDWYYKQWNDDQLITLDSYNMISVTRYALSVRQISIHIAINQFTGLNQTNIVQDWPFVQQVNFYGGYTVQAKYAQINITNMYTQKRVVVFGWKQLQKKFTYTLIILSDQDSYIRFILQIQGESMQQPQFIASQNLTKIIIYGKQLDTSPFYVGYSVNYTSAQTSDIVFPETVSNFFNKLTINQNSLYVRNLKNLPNGKANHSA